MLDFEIPREVLGLRFWDSERGPRCSFLRFGGICLGIRFWDTLCVYVFWIGANYAYILVRVYLSCTVAILCATCRRQAIHHLIKRETLLVKRWTCSHCMYMYLNMYEVLRMVTRKFWVTQSNFWFDLKILKSFMMSHKVSSQCESFCLGASF